MIRQPAFASGLKPLKGALHCHTTRSDGSGAPDEVIRLHALYGYDFMAITDHRQYNYANFAPDVPMTIIPGMEMDGGFKDPGVHCHHHVVIGPPKQQGNEFEQDQRFNSYKITGQQDTQYVLDMLHANGNMTIYCHPEWSGTPARDFDQLRGNFAMEIWNSGCAIEHGSDTDAAYWDELLLQGQKIYGVATDDGHPMCHHGNGWVRVSAENDVMSILDALKAGAFYSSCGPEIYDFYIEDGVARVRCAPASRVLFHCGYRPAHQGVAGKQPLLEAEFKVPDYATYLRAEVIDLYGRKAWTNPIWLNQ